jgi:hypothetical protein
MILSMTRPSKHPKSGIYWFRKRVPDDLRNLIGKREEHFSLGTRDPSEAKRLHALKLAEVEERWTPSGRPGQPATSVAFSSMPFLREAANSLRDSASTFFTAAIGSAVKPQRKSA